jgi:hypothetical protein
MSDASHSERLTTGELGICQEPGDGAAMTFTSREPDPERQRLARSMVEPASLKRVAEAVAAATEWERRIYVERLGDLWRWKLISDGGAYPLLRNTANFLRMDYRALLVGAVAGPGGSSIVSTDADRDVQPDAKAVIEFEGPATPAQVEERIRHAFGSRGSGSE